MINCSILSPVVGMATFSLAQSKGLDLFDSTTITGIALQALSIVGVLTSDNLECYIITSWTGLAIGAIGIIGNAHKAVSQHFRLIRIADDTFLENENESV